MAEEQEVTLEDCIRSSNRKRIALLTLLVALIFLSVYTLTIGSVDISPSRILDILFNRGTTTEDIVIWEWRLPIIIGTLMVGAGLGIAGAVMQCILKNPLGSPYTLGLSSAAAFGASFGIVISEGIFGGVASDVSPYFITFNAFIWSLIATGFIILMAKYTNVSPESMVLAGVAIGSIFSAGVSAFQYFSNDSTLASIVYWQFGDVTKLSWDEITIIGVVLLACCTYFFYKRWDYNALDAGDETARCLGVNVNSTRIVGMIMAALLTSIVVSFVGIIGFIGLLGPHIVRRVLGGDHRFLLFGSMLVGSLILLIANTVGQNAFNFVMPVGIITSFLGGPLFLYILLKSYRRKGY